jgi:uncharacterized protein (TIGR03435 family)
MKSACIRPLPAFAVLAGTAMAVSSLAPVRAQTPVTDPLPRFEVAAVKENVSGAENGRMITQPGGRFIATNARLKLLIADAFIGAQPGAMDRVIGGPDWVQTARYDITAKAPREFRPTPPGPPAEMLLMIRSLLEERFKLRVHRETRELPAYELTLARPGTVAPGLRQSQVDCDALYAAWTSGPPPLQPGVRAECRFNGGPGGLVVGAMTMPQLAQFLQRLGQPVIDKTGLTGRYDFDLAFAPLAPPTAGTASDPSLPTIFVALEEQLGLKLTSKSLPLDVIVIDSLERPIPE